MGSPWELKQVPPITTDRTIQDDIRHDRAYLAGLQAGWNLGVSSQNADFNRIVNSLLAELTEARKAACAALGDGE